MFGEERVPECRGILNMVGNTRASALLVPDNPGTLEICPRLNKVTQRRVGWLEYNMTVCLQEDGSILSFS